VAAAEPNDPAAILIVHPWLAKGGFRSFWIGIGSLLGAISDYGMARPFPRHLI
jgi:hypothetical protein